MTTQTSTMKSHITPALRSLAEFDGWIFTNTGKNCQRGRNGTNRRLTDLHYHDRWDWIMPVYTKLCAIAGKEHQGALKAIQSAILLNDIEVAGELCGKMAERLRADLKFQCLASGGYSK